MPIYEYKCIDCGAHVEKMQKISDAPLTVCESCGGKMEKQLSLSGFQFKGAGWYVTDYSGTKNKKGGESGEKSGGGESTASGDSASKPKETPAPAKDSGPASKE